MEKWNTSERAMGIEDCPKIGLFVGLKDINTKKGNKIKVVALDCAEGSFWLPVFKVAGANIPLSQCETKKKSTVEVIAVKDMFVLNFKDY
jgi:hypothetical protein